MPSVDDMGSETPASANRSQASKSPTEQPGCGIASASPVSPDAEAIGQKIAEKWIQPKWIRSEAAITTAHETCAEEITAALTAATMREREAIEEVCKVRLEFLAFEQPRNWLSTHREVEAILAAIRDRSAQSKEWK